MRFRFAHSFGLTWRQVGAFAVFCLAYAAPLSTSPRTGGLPDTPGVYVMAVAKAFACFLPVLLAVTVTAGFAPRRPVARALTLGVAVAAGAVAGSAMDGGLQHQLARWSVAPINPAGHHSLYPASLIMIGWLGLAVFLFQERERASAQAMHDEQERKATLALQMSESQLKVLQSQVEPHFLFNTLAHVRRLYQTDPPSGRAMMRHLTHYVGAALPALQERDITLRRELELTRAYINIQQIRMGPRLAFEIEVPDSVLEARVPPMAVTTLVENSIKHGLWPLREGGTVSVTARELDGTARIEVRDTGLGFQASIGSGVGLANTRARLAMLHGGRARLSLSQNSPRGVIATIVAPLGAVRA